FQAEDGIRVRNVTGVQTCALPISVGRASTIDAGAERLVQYFSDRSAQHSTRSLLVFGMEYVPGAVSMADAGGRRITAIWPACLRSEERRVGNERVARQRDGRVSIE